jgi:hypothetical protein
MVNIKFEKFENKIEVWIEGAFQGWIRKYDGKYIYESYNIVQRFYTSAELKLIARKIDEKNTAKRS